MIKSGQRILRKIAPSSIKHFIRSMSDLLSWDPWSRRSWSQEGEDLVLDRILAGKKTGFYIDVGAHHPKRFSNTYLFYRRGWSGINIDAMPESMRSFHKWRPRDINLEIGIALRPNTLDYFIFDEPALNGFSSELAIERHEADNPYSIRRVVKVDVKPLSEILKKHFDGDSIDFLTVDVEGFDLEVLKSNDWVKYRPRVVLAEILGSDLSDLDASEIVSFMTDTGYRVIAKTGNTAFFVDNLGVEP